MGTATTTTSAKSRQRKPKKVEEKKVLEPISEEELHEQFNQMLNEAPTGKTTVEKLGFVRITAPEYEWVTYPDASDPETALKAEIQCNLSFAESDSIVLHGRVTFEEIRESIAPYVRAWNLQGRDIETGTIISIPAPMEGGVEMLMALDQKELIWLTMAIKYKFREIHDTDEGKKNLTLLEPSEKQSPAIMKREKKST
jgi:hypothetical protein